MAMKASETMWMLLLLVVLRMTATPVTNTGGGVGGVFFPSVAIGAGIGKRVEAPPLDVGMRSVEGSIEVTAVERLDRLPDPVHVLLRHRVPRSMSRGAGEAGGEGRTTLARGGAM